MKLKRRKLLLDRSSLILLALPILSLILSLNTNGYAGDYDSVFHYFMSDSVAEVPINFLSQWNKPIYTLFTFLPALVFGYKGVVFINLLAILGSFYLLYRVLDKMGVQFAWVLLLFPFLLRSVFPYGATALTEPIATLYLSSLIYLLSTKKYVPFYILCGFAFLIRQEFLIAVPFALVLTLSQRKWLGVVYPFIGIVLYESLLHLTNLNDRFSAFTGGYDVGESVYGSGPLLHFVNRFEVISGGFLWVIFTGLAIVWILFMGAKKILRKNRGLDNSTITALFSSYMFLGIISGHSLVWFLGIYASAGMERVLLPILPLSAFLICYGLFQLKTRYARIGLIITLLFLAANNFVFEYQMTGYYYTRTFKTTEHGKEIKQIQEDNSFNLEEGLLNVNFVEAAFYLDLNPKLKEVIIRDGNYSKVSNKPFFLLVDKDKFENLEIESLGGSKLLSNGQYIIWSH